MAVNRFISNNDILNQVAVEVGLTPVVDTFSSEDPAFQQLKFLLTTCVQELMEMYPWQILTRQFVLMTASAPGETGKYDLPADFAYMIDQTGWEQSQNVPLLGPLSPQEYTYLVGRDLAGSTIYASFRFNENQFWIFPTNPAPQDLEITFEYISRNLIQKSGITPTEYTDTAEDPADIPVFVPHLIKRLLKAKYLEAKGFDSQTALDSFWQAFYSWTGKDNSAPILNIGRNWRNFPYLNAVKNTPDTGYGRLS